MFKFELKVALRHLLTSHGQTELTVGAVAVGVLLVVFLSSLINGMEVGMIDDVVGTIPHITIEAGVPSAKPLWQVRGKGIDGTIVTKLEKMSRQKRKVDQWQSVSQSIESLPGVQAVAPSAEGSGIVGRGAKTLGTVIVGVNPAEQLRVTPIQNRIVEGSFLRVDQLNAAIGTKMADDLGVVLGDRIQVASDQGVMQTFRVACIYDLGVEAANDSRVYVGLPAAQALLKMGRDVTTINVRTDKMLAAEKVAEQIRAFSPLTVTSWMQSNKAFLDTLKAQDASAVIIQAMTLLASAFGVTSVMIVFVVQKSKDIGILKSMGATSRQIQRIFMLEGLGVGLAGAAIGAGLGTGLCFLAQNLFIPGQLFGGKPATIVPMKWDVIYVLAASAVALFMGLASSVIPARRAARLNPVEAIRHG